MERGTPPNKTTIKSLWVILLLIFFFPAGLLLMWLKTNWNKRAKWAVTAVLGIIVLLGVIGNNAPPSTTNPKTTESSQISQPQPKTTPTPAVQIHNPPAPPKILSEQDQIKKIVTDKISDKNNLDRDYLRKVDVVDQVDGGWGVFIDYNADDNLTADLRKKGIQMTMSQLYIVLYTSGKDIRTVSVAAYFPMTDKYGNSSDGIIYKTFLDKSEADKVNWKTDPSVLELNVLPKVWETTINFL